MAAQPSFDVTSTVDLQEVDNAVNQAKKEIAQRYDFKGSKSSIEFKKQRERHRARRRQRLQDGRGLGNPADADDPARVPVKNLELSDPVQMAGGTVKRNVSLQQGVPIEAAKTIVQCLKDQKLKKVQAAIQGDQLRISSPSKDELQTPSACSKLRTSAASCSSAIIGNEVAWNDEVAQEPRSKSDFRKNQSLRASSWASWFKARYFLGLRPRAVRVPCG